MSRFLSPCSTRPATSISRGVSWERRWLGSLSVSAKIPSSSQVFPLVTDRKQITSVSGSEVRRSTPRAPACRNRSASDSLIPTPQITRRPALLPDCFPRRGKSMQPIRNRRGPERFVNYYGRGVQPAGQLESRLKRRHRARKPQVVAAAQPPANAFNRHRLRVTHQNLLYCKIAWLLPLLECLLAIAVRNIGTTELFL